MNWLNLHTRVARAPEYIGSEPTQRATWLSIMLYCVEQENGGVILGAKSWKDRQWQQTCGVTLKEVSRSAPLLNWSGENLVVWEYPTVKEAEVKGRRDAGRLGGMRSGIARANTREAELEAELEANNEANAENCRQTDEASDERKEKEKEKENRKEGEGKVVASLLPFGSAEFADAWSLFLRHRSEIRKPLKPTSAEMSLKMLQGIGEQRAIACIHHTIEKGWQGLREPDQRDRKQSGEKSEWVKRWENA